MIYSIMVFYDFIKINHDQAANSCLVYLLSPTARLESEISIFVSDSGNWTLPRLRRAFLLIPATSPNGVGGSYYGVLIHEITEMQVANMGNYAHGNQPAQHMIDLYDYARKPEKAQWWAREVMDRLYSAPTDTAATRTTARLQHGMYSRPWGSIPYAPRRTNTP